MEKLQAPGSQAQPCYEPTLKSLFDLLGKSLHLFCKDRDGIFKCSVFSLIVCDGCRGGNGGGSTLHGRLSLKVGKTYPGEVTSAATVSRLCPIFCFSCPFSCRRLLPQRHTHGCHMNAMLKPRNRLAVPTAPVSQAGSLGIWLLDLFGCSFTRITFPIKVM
jgi:hypothetical protein